MPETTRLVTISIDRDPPISGWGGYDEWQITVESSMQMDALMERIESVIRANARRFKTAGGYTGVT